MRIAQVAPLTECVPPKYYGGTECVVSYLTEELVKQGHDVFLFASGDSETNAQLIPTVPQALRLNKKCIDPLTHYILLLDKVAGMAHEFDIIHFHIDFLHFPLTRLLNIPNITTLHGRLDLPDLIPVYREFDDMPVVSISNDQRKPLLFANWQATVYNGLPDDLHTFNQGPGEYLAFLGRISPEKGIEDAIEIAKKAETPLKIAAKIDKVDEEYYENIIKPMINHPLIEYLGEIGVKEKNEFLGKAHALIFPINWPEPFGLVMIEAMACGTPVIAYRRGSVPEVMMSGKTGFIVNTIEEALDAVKRVDMISRDGCRRIFEERFTASKMATGYLDVYRSIIDSLTQPQLAV